MQRCHRFNWITSQQSNNTIRNSSQRTPLQIRRNFVWEKKRMMSFFFISRDMDEHVSFTKSFVYKSCLIFFTFTKPRSRALDRPLLRAKWGVSYFSQIIVYEAVLKPVLTDWSYITALVETSLLFLSIGYFNTFLGPHNVKVHSSKDSPLKVLYT